MRKIYSIAWILPDIYMVREYVLITENKIHSASKKVPLPFRYRYLQFSYYGFAYIYV